MKTPHTPLRPLTPGPYDATGWAAKVRSSIAGPVLFGTVVLVGFVGGFGVWASTAPLEGAAIAPGVVVASGQNNTIQHLEGGIIERVLVSEGERVEEGQELIRLERTSPEASRDLLRKGLFALEARVARLQAERDGAMELELPADLVQAAADFGLSGDLEEQRREFSTRVSRLVNDRNIVDQRIAALNEQIAGYETQLASTREQIAVLDNDIARKKQLLDRQLTNRSEYNALRRSREELRGRIGQLTAQMGGARTSILEAQEQQSRLVTQRAEQAVTDLNEVRRQIADTRERLRSAEDVLSRVSVRSPSTGVVVNIAKTTPGAVVQRGEELMTILPTDSELIVEARLPPIDVDVVRVGQEASLRFSALNQRTTPEVPATVSFVSSDALTDPQSRESYYVMRLKIADELPDNVSAEQIFPGMPVETYVKTGDRTFLEYMVKPISDSFSKAFREE